GVDSTAVAPASTQTSPRRAGRVSRRSARASGEALKSYAMGDAPGRTGTYDAIVAGASFAGLATALQLRGRVLVLDHGPVGDGQTSACGTTLAAIEAMDARHTVQQVHRHLVLHLAPPRGRPRVLRYRLPYAFCTFDYRALCQTLAARAAQRGVEF